MTSQADAVVIADCLSSEAWVTALLDAVDALRVRNGRPPMNSVEREHLRDQILGRAPITRAP